MVRKIDSGLNEVASLQGHLNGILKTVGEGILSIDTNSTILLANDEIARLWGYELDEIIGKPVQILMPKRYRPMHTAGIKGFTEAGGYELSGRWQEVDGLRKDGSEFLFYIRLNRVPYDGELYVTAAVREARAHLETRQALHDVLAQLEMLLDSGDDPTMLRDLVVSLHRHIDDFEMPEKMAPYEPEYEPEDD